MSGGRGKGARARALAELPSAATLSAWCDLLGAMHTELSGQAAAAPAPGAPSEAAAARAVALGPLCLWLLACFAQAEEHERLQGWRPWPAAPPGRPQ